MGWLVQGTNCHAVADGAGSGTYADFVLFDLPKLYKSVGLLFANGLTPKPQFEYWFEGQGGEPLFGNDKYARVMDKHLRRATRSARSVSGNTSGDTSPCWNSVTIQRRVSKQICCGRFVHFLTELNKQASRMWLPGKFFAINKQTIGFQGSSGLKIRISYKRKGNGFQCWRSLLSILVLILTLVSAGRPGRVAESV
jgi:hypothetical protein